MPFLLALLLVVSFVGSAKATFLLEIERVSDTVGILTGSGSVGSTAPSGNSHILVLDNPYTVAPRLCRT
jgi:hypothetical protein